MWAFLEFVPDEVTTFYKDLTDEDKAVLKELAGKHATFANEDEALAALKNKSPKLHAKAEELRTLIKGRIDTLNPEAKTFVNGVSVYFLCVFIFSESLQLCFSKIPFALLWSDSFIT